MSFNLLFIASALCLLFHSQSLLIFFCFDVSRIYFPLFTTWLVCFSPAGLLCCILDCHFPAPHHPAFLIATTSGGLISPLILLFCSSFSNLLRKWVCCGCFHTEIFWRILMKNQTNAVTVIKLSPWQRHFLFRSTSGSLKSDLILPLVCWCTTKVKAKAIMTFLGSLAILEAFLPTLESLAGGRATLEHRFSSKFTDLPFALCKEEEGYECLLCNYFDWMPIRTDLPVYARLMFVALSALFDWLWIMEFQPYW